MAKTENRTIAQNKKAYHDYFVEESLEAGIELFGTEVKSLRQGRCNLKDAWCSVVDGEMLLNGCHISAYEQGNIFNRDPMRVRRLLLHKREIMRLLGLSKTAGYSLIPLSMYFKGSRVKVQVGLCRAKSFTTSAPTWLSATPSATWIVRSRKETDKQRLLPLSMGM
jgi:SsrA-binding protein